MKIGIMSMQRIRNYGSFLQSYALKKIIEEIYEQDFILEFVDYHVQQEWKTFKFIKKVCTYPFKSKAIMFLSNRRIFKKKYDAEYFALLGLREENYQENAQSDILVIGSDEVFNCTQSFGFSPDLFGANGGKKKTISYAASFGYTDMEGLTRSGYKEEIAEMLKSNFDALSVRDENSCKIVMDLIGQRPEIHLDPVLIYGFRNNCEIPPIHIEEKYIILYGYFGNFTKEECSEIHSYAKENKLKIYCIFGQQYVCDKYVIDDPFSILSYFQNAEAVITDTFHGTIFSIINHRPLVVIPRTRNENKLVDLLQRVGLNDVRMDICRKSTIEKVLGSPPDYDAVEKIINTYRKSAKQYLKKQLEDL